MAIVDCGVLCGYTEGHGATNCGVAGLASGSSHAPFWVPRSGDRKVRPGACGVWDTEGGPRTDISRVLCHLRDGDHLSATPVARRL